MNGVAMVLRELRDSETALADVLASTARRQQQEPEIRDTAGLLADWSRLHAHRLTELAAERQAEHTTADSRPGDPESRLPDLAAAALPGPNGLALLRDLRRIYLATAENSLHWEILGQTAQADRDGALLRLVAECHPRTLRQQRWANTLIKTLCPQILAGS